MAEGFSVLSRRRFLRWSLGAGALVAMGGGGLLALRGRAPDVTGLRLLGEHQYRTLSRLAEALFPAVVEDGLDMARAFDTFLADEPEWNRADLGRALFLLEYGPVIFERRLVTFSHLSPAERIAHFEAWSTSDSLLRRQVAVAFRRFLCIVFYDRPAAWARVGYDGPRPMAAAGA